MAGAKVASDKNYLLIYSAKYQLNTVETKVTFLFPKYMYGCLKLFSLKLTFHR